MLDNKKPIVTINLTPLVDVSLVLVVIFMATAPMFLQSGIIVTSGGKKAAPGESVTKKSDNIIIKLTPDKIWLNKRDVKEGDLSRLLRRMLDKAENRRVIINPDRKVLHGRVIEIMDLAKQCGASALVILGKSKKLKP